MSAERCCPGEGTMAHVRGCFRHPEYAADLSVPPFERVSDIDFDDHEPLRVVKVVRVPDNDDGWDW